MAVTLGWRDVLLVISFALAVDGYRRAYRERRVRTEERRRTMRLVAASSLRTLEHAAYEIEVSLVAGAWERAGEQVGRLRLALAEGVGGWGEFLVGADADKARAAAARLADLHVALQSLGTTQPDEPRRLDMRQQCATVYTLAAELAGRFTYAHEETPTRWAPLGRRLGSSRGSDL